MAKRPKRPKPMREFHRPRTFNQLVGQPFLVRTLRNAIEKGQPPP